MSDATFGRKSRIVAARDYKAIFNNADWKASTELLTVLGSRNYTQNARLGIVIGRKNYRYATQRNRLKRLVRESFRQDRHNIQGLDVVVLIRAGFQTADNRTVMEQLAKLWNRLQRNVQTRQAGSLSGSNGVSSR